MPTKVFDDLPNEKRILIKKSIDKITFNSLAQEAGFARTSLYVYFKDKTDLCNYVFHDFSDSITIKLKQIKFSSLTPTNSYLSMLSFQLVLYFFGTGYLVVQIPLADIDSVFIKRRTALMEIELNATLFGLQI